VSGTLSVFWTFDVPFTTNQSGTSPNLEFPMTALRITPLALVLCYVFILDGQPAQPPKKTKESLNPFTGERLYVSPDSDPARWAKSEKAQEKALLFSKVAAGAECRWLGDWTKDPEADVSAYCKKLEQAKCLPVLVLYNIPLRDQGEYSAGGEKTPDGYRRWIDSVAKGIGKSKVVVIVEPDALPQLDRLKEDQRKDRLELVKYAIEKLCRRRSPGVA
jgi:endoglucanase